MTATAAAVDIHRIGAKLFADNPEVIRPDAYIAMFHRWIQAGDLDGVPIDVADYKHVPKGPGIMLISHEADRCLDFADDRPGVIYQRKRDLSGDLRERIESVLRSAESMAARIEDDPAGDGVRFGRGEVELRFHDRRLVPNSEDGLDAVRDAVVSAAHKVWTGTEVSVTRHQDHPRGPLTLTLALS
jgi:hypothetical protein